MIDEEYADQIEDSIETYQEILEVESRETSPIGWADTMSLLGATYFERLRGDRANNLEEAILACEQALEVIKRPSMPIKWARIKSNLAAAYSKRLLGDRFKNIERSIENYEEALTVMTKDSSRRDWALVKSNLGNAYRVRLAGEKIENLEKAIDLYNESLTVYAAASMSYEWALTMNNIGIVLRHFSQLKERNENLSRAIKSFKQALSVRTREAFPVEWAQTLVNMGHAYKESGLAKEASHSYKSALTVLTPEAQTADCRSASRALGELSMEQCDWATAVESYRLSIDAAEKLYAASLLRTSQEAELIANDNLYRCAAYAYAKAGDLETAVATIEQGRARSLSETLRRDRSDLAAIRQINPELVKRYEAAAAMLRNLEATERSTHPSVNQPQSSKAALQRQATQARQTQQACIADIRQIPGYEAFLTLPTFADIAATLQPAQPLVYLIPTPNGTLALITQLQSHDAGKPPATDITSVWLDTFTESVLEKLLVGEEKEITGWFRAYYRSVLTSADNPTLKAQNRENWFKELDRITNHLWGGVMAPILPHLSPSKIQNPKFQFPPTVTLIPTGYLSFLPLHAAWMPDDTTPTKRRYACDTVVFTYAPNALALHAARTQANTLATTLLAVDEPQPCADNQLPSSAQEVAAAVSHFPQHQILRHTAATREAVLAALPQHTVWHFSCHGGSDIRNPLDNGLLMSNGQTLSLRDLLALHLQGIRLAVLSACETGMPGTALPDEVVSLPTGLLQAGVAGVVASLWSVSDLSTMMLLSRFYDLWRTEQLPPHQALHQAQIWLRDSTNEAKVTEFQGFLSTFAGDRMPQSTAQQLYDELAWEVKQERSFAHPFHWAAFSYTGA